MVAFDACAQTAVYCPTSAVVYLRFAFHVARSTENLQLLQPLSMEQQCDKMADVKALEHPTLKVFTLSFTSTLNIIDNNNIFRCIQKVPYEI